MRNYVNIPFSLALRHQLYQCYLGLNTANIAMKFEVGPGKLCIIQGHIVLYLSA